MSDIGLWTRLYDAAKRENVTVEEMARWSDKQLGRIPNVGPKSLEALRKRYPREPQPTETSDRERALQALEQAAAAVEVAIAILKWSKP